MESIDMLLNDLESEVLKAKKATFSQTDIVINKNVLLDLVTRIRSSYPQVVKDAYRVVKERDNIIAEANAYANSRIEEAVAQAQKLVAENDIVQKANRDAAAIRAQADDIYKKIRYDACAQAYKMLDDVEVTLKNAMYTVNTNKRRLADYSNTGKKDN